MSARRRRSSPPDWQMALRVLVGLGLAVGFFATGKEFTPVWAVFIGGLVGLDQLVLGASKFVGGMQQKDSSSDRDQRPPASSGRRRRFDDDDDLDDDRTGSLRVRLVMP